MFHVVLLILGLIWEAIASISTRFASVLSLFVKNGRRRGISWVAGVLSLSIVGVTAAASAQDAPAADVSYNRGEVTVEASTPGSLRVVTRPGVRRDGVNIECEFYEWDGEILDFVAVRPYERTLTYLLDCWISSPGVAVEDQPSISGYPKVWPWSRRLPPEVVNGWEAGEYALNSLNLEAPIPALSPQAEQIVGVPTWLAVTSQLDYPSATAQAGNVWATVTPSFVSAVWDFGNGETARCTADVATTWDPALTSAAQDSTCTHTFTVSSGDTPLNGSVTVTWSVWHTSNETAPGGAWWGNVSRTTPVTFVVRDLQAVIN